MAWEERAIVPYEASRFDARRALVLAPHPDDEVFGCGAAIASLRAAGAEVNVVLVTDGAGDEPNLEARRRLAERRYAESRRALAHLGGANVETLGFPDRGVGAARRRLEAILRERFARLDPDLVFVPSPSEIHPDHRAVAKAALAAVSALRRSARIAFYEVSQPIRPNVLLDATPHVAAKDRAMAEFASQSGDRDYPGTVRGLNAYRRLTLPPSVVAAEAFAVVPATALASPRTRAAHLRRLGPEIDVPPRGLTALLRRADRA